MAITCSCSLGFPELGVRENPEAGEPQLRAGRDAVQESLAESPACCFLLPASAQSWVLELYQSRVYGSPPEPERPGLALSLLRGPRGLGCRDAWTSEHTHEMAFT